LAPSDRRRRLDLDARARPWQRGGWDLRCGPSAGRWRGTMRANRAIDRRGRRDLCCQSVSCPRFPSRLRRSLRAKSRSARLDPRALPWPSSTETFWRPARPIGRLAHQKVTVAKRPRRRGAVTPRRRSRPAGPERSDGAASWPRAIACNRPDLTATRRRGPPLPFQPFTGRPRRRGMTAPRRRGFVWLASSLRSLAMTAAAEAAPSATADATSPPSAPSECL
jgi:hypothetical protein